MIKTIAGYFGAAIAGMLLSAVVTLVMMNKGDAQKVTKEATAVVATAAKDVVKASEENTRIEEKLDQGKSTASLVKSEVAAQLKPTKEIVYVQVEAPGKTEKQTCPAVTGDSPIPLTARSVRLLNDLRAAKSVDLTAINPSEIQAASGLTIAEFVNNDTDVVGLYNELATRHDELVDAVVAFMKKQAEDAAARK